MSDLIEIDKTELTSDGIPLGEIMNAGAIEIGLELIEGLHEIIEISSPEESKTLHRVAFMIEAFLEKDFNCVIERELDG